MAQKHTAVEGDSRKAWALAVRLDGIGSPLHLLGRYCWKDATESDYPVRLFLTRKDAIEKRASCCYPSAQIVRVSVQIAAVSAAQ